MPLKLLLLLSSSFNCCGCGTGSDEEGFPDHLLALTSLVTLCAKLSSYRPPAPLPQLLSESVHSNLRQCTSPAAQAHNGNVIL